METEAKPTIIEEIKIFELTRLRNPEEICRQIESFIRVKMIELRRVGLILGLSGGLDSAVTICLCKRSVGAEKVLALYMPDRDSDSKHGKDAEKLAGELGIRFETIDITPIMEAQGTYKYIPWGLRISKRLTALILKGYYWITTKVLKKDKFSDSLGGSNSAFTRKGNVYAKSKHRIRMCKLYEHAGIGNLLVVGAANKTESMIGFFAQWGIDHATDIMPIGHLNKTQVRDLARYLKVPKEIIEKPPSPDLIPGFTDEGIVGSYKTIDLILYGLERGLSADKISEQLNISVQKVEQVNNWIKKSAHMRESPYVPELEPSKNEAK